jgi:hypothetical protein
VFVCKSVCSVIGTAIDAKVVYDVELVDSQAELARKRSVKVAITDLAEAGESDHRVGLTPTSCRLGRSTSTCRASEDRGSERSAAGACALPAPRLLTRSAGDLMQIVC